MALYLPDDEQVYFTFTDAAGLNKDAKGRDRGGWCKRAVTDVAERYLRAYRRRLRKKHKEQPHA